MKLKNKIATVLAAIALVAIAGCSSPVVGGVDSLPGSVPEGVTYTPGTDGFPAPAIVGTLTDGTKVDKELVLSGRPAILLFFTGWCVQCSDSEKRLDALYEKYGDAITSVHIDGTTADDEATVTQYVKENNIRGPVVLDPSGQTWRNYAVKEPPAVGLVDSKGNLIKLWANVIDWDTMDATVASLISLPE